MATVKTKIVSRHAGTIAWLASKGVQGEVIAQASPEDFKPGDVIYGVLPVPLIAEALQRGARVILTVLPAVALGERGKELTPAEMDRAGAKLLEVIGLQLKEVK